MSREIQVRVNRGAQEQSRWMVDVRDPDSTPELRDILRDWLEAERIDPDLWPRYTLTTLNTVRLVEVHA
jgi:hypothetical protein